MTASPASWGETRARRVTRNARRAARAASLSTMHPRLGPPPHRRESLRVPLLGRGCLPPMPKRRVETITRPTHTAGADMRNAHLGALEVSRIGLGAMTMAGTYTSGGGLNDAESIATIHRALDLGVTHIDT